MVLLDLTKDAQKDEVFQLMVRTVWLSTLKCDYN